jgi:hypothetical protein
MRIEPRYLYGFPHCRTDERFSNGLKGSAKKSQGLSHQTGKIMRSAARHHYMRRAIGITCGERSARRLMVSMSPNPHVNVDLSWISRFRGTDTTRPSCTCCRATLDGRVVGARHRLPIDRIGGPTTASLAASFCPFKYRKCGTAIFLEIPGNIPRFVKLTTYCGHRLLPASQPSAFFWRIMSNASHRAECCRDLAVGYRPPTGFSAETRNRFWRIGRPAAHTAVEGTPPS